VRLLVDVPDGGQDLIFEPLFGQAQRGARELGKEALDQVEPRAVFRRDGEGEASEAAFGLCSQPRLGLY
jgi:hypothetical protein